MKKSTALTLFLGSGLTLLAEEKPNIIIMYIDDMGYADISCNGSAFPPTPNIDQIAKEGIRFTQYYSACPISSPSRVAITTGMYPTRWAITTFLQTRAGNKSNEQNDFLNNIAPSMARLLKENGYATGHFGKWHMGGGRDVYNAPAITSYGFDEYNSTWESPDPDPNLTATNWIWSDLDSVKRWNRTSYFVDRTLGFLEKNKGKKPCFINFWPDDVHTPWVMNNGGFSSPDSEWQQPENFKAVLYELDIQIGRLMQGLKDLGIDKNTIVIFTSDNGPDPSFQNVRTAAMRGQKGTLYEGGIRLPFIVRWPDHIEPNQVITESVICSIDLLPTFCKITGATLPTSFSIDGEDRSSILLGGANAEREKPLFWEFGKNKKNRVSPHIAVREGNWKLLINADESNLELYNLKTDLFEKNNVAIANPDTANRLKLLALNWYKENFRQYADIGTGVAETFSDKFEISPNPVKTELKIQTSLAGYSTNIYNILGKKILSSESDLQTINLSNLESGVYILNIEQNGSTFFRKFIKE